jgi:hypothetical protein
VNARASIDMSESNAPVLTVVPSGAPADEVAAELVGDASSTLPHALPPQALAAVLHLAHRAQQATSVAELGFTLTNETLSLVPFRQAAFFTVSASGKPQLANASGLASVAEDSPFAVWLTRFAKSFATTGGCHRLDFADAASDDTSDESAGWAEWLPDHVLTAPLQATDGTLHGLLMYAREAPWNDTELALLDQVHQNYAYCLSSLVRKRQGVRHRMRARLRGRWISWGVPALLLAMLIPVRLSALAPAEVVALNALAVAAPQEGVISKFHVQPNSAVKTGDLLFSLDDTTLTSRREVAAKGLTIARADALVYQQRAFDDAKSKGELASAFGRVHEKEAELAQIEAALARIDVRAERNGMAVFADANDWIGRPVQTGERVMQLADPQDAGLMVWLPAADALNLEPGAPMRLFLHTQPLAPLSAQLLQTSYQAVPSPEGVSSYRLRGQFDGAATPRIGLRGTARVSGDWAVLGYYVFRRPIAAVREWTGL